MPELPELMALIGVQLVLPDLTWDGRCPVCGCGTSSARSGTGLRLCLLCTEAEVGETASDLAARLSRRMAARAYYALPRDNDGRPVLPALTYRRWRELSR